MPLIAEMLCSKLCEPTNVGCVSQKMGNANDEAKFFVFQNLKYSRG